MTVMVKPYYIDDGLGAIVTEAGGIALYDTRAYTPSHRETLSIGAMTRLVDLFFDGLCPVCSIEIPQGDVVCDGCYQAASDRRVYGPPLPDTYEKGSSKMEDLK